MKLDPHLPQLPSIGELLEHPRVKGVVARINGSTLAHRAAGFLDELKSSLTERAGRIEMPSVTQLAERLARRLLGEPLSSGPVINATGVVVGDPDFTPPLADAAVHAMTQIASEYHRRSAELQKAIEHELCSLTGAEAALVLNSFDAALNVVFTATAANREVLVAEGAVAPNTGIDWRRLAARHSAVLRTSAGDAAALAAAVEQGDQPAAIVRSPEAEGLATTGEVASIANRVNALFVDVASMAGVVDPAAYGLQSVETLRERLASDADLVIAGGAGLLGGPVCGIIVGKRKLVESAASHYLASIASLDAAPAAALHATLAAYRDDHDGRAAFAIPVLQLLSTPLANLQQRADRLAALIAVSPLAASAEARAAESPWRRAGNVSLLAPTWIVAIRPATGDAASLLARLRQRPYPIVGTELDGAVHLDLRSVFPRWDQQLVAAFESTDVEGRPAIIAPVFKPG
jgi:L-seryl-tRNA(Ser) seleniumtransferase